MNCASALSCKNLLRISSLIVVCSILFVPDQSVAGDGYDALELRWYGHHLHPGNGRQWERQANDATADPNDPSFVKCVHSCRHPDLVYQDCLDNGLDGCFLTHHSTGINQSLSRQWVTASTVDHTDPCGGVIPRDPNGWELSDGTHTLDEWTWQIDVAEQFMVANPGFFAGVSVEWTVPGGEPANYQGGHKVLACDKPIRPYCATNGGGGTTEYFQNVCSGEGELYDVAKGTVTLYDPNEAPQHCTITTAHPCGDGGGARTYFGPYDASSAPGGLDYSVVKGYAALVDSSLNNGCVFPEDEVLRTGEWDALALFSLFNKGFWLHTQADEDFHHIRNTGSSDPLACTRNEWKIAGLQRRTGCWVSANTGPEIVTAHENYLCYYSKDTVSLKVSAYDENPNSNPAAVPLAIMGGETTIADPGSVWLSVAVAVEAGAVGSPFPARLDVRHNEALVASCLLGSSDPDCTCDGTSCNLVREFTDADMSAIGGLTGWYSVHVYNTIVDEAGADHPPNAAQEAIASGLRINWASFPLVPQVPLFPHSH
ncbi:MAG: hypothetical protein GY725_15950 [bacterium]|nr:hypothetical protein [bacterium]